MSAAEELRAAATRIREFAEGTTPADGDPSGWLGNVNEQTGHAFIFGGPTENGYRTGVVFEFKDELDCEECTRPSAEDLRWTWLMSPLLAEPLAKWLSDEADRWDVEMKLSLLECPGCDGSVPCSHPAEGLWHEDGCERDYVELTPESEGADWRCDCFDNALAVARAINGGAT